MTATGRFVWYDLMAPDVAAAQAFYTYVAGWGTQAWEGDTTPYTMWTVRGTPIGGAMSLPPEARGVPPHWLGYVSTDDVDASCLRAQELGGQVHRPPSDIPGVGRFAVVSDPQGAAFALFASNEPMEPSFDRREAGIFSWAELNTTDWEAAWKFYAALLGWKPTMSMDMGPDVGTYFMFTHQAGGDVSMGGMSNAATMMKAPAHWLFYMNVSDIGQALARVQERGGKVLNGPMDVPGNGKIAQCMDPQGALFAVYYES